MPVSADRSGEAAKEQRVHSALDTGEVVGLDGLAEMLQQLGYDNFPCAYEYFHGGFDGSLSRFANLGVWRDTRQAPKINMHQRGIEAEEVPSSLLYF